MRDWLQTLSVTESEATDVKAHLKAEKRISNAVRRRRFLRIEQGSDVAKLAPFKIKFNRMSKSSSLNRSNSAETDHEHANSPKKRLTLSPDAKKGNDSVSDEDVYISEVSSKVSTLNHSHLEDLSNQNDYAGEKETLLSETVKQTQSPTTPPKAPEIMHTSSKEFYKAVAKQFGITCKMSDHCRCYDCQSHYFDCEYEQNEQEKTDGGLGAGTPVFLHEVMHGSACIIL